MEIKTHLEKGINITRQIMGQSWHGLLVSLKPSSNLSSVRAIAARNTEGYYFTFLSLADIFNSSSLSFRTMHNYIITSGLFYCGHRRSQAIPEIPWVPGRRGEERREDAVMSRQEKRTNPDRKLTSLFLPYFNFFLASFIYPS